MLTWEKTVKEQYNLIYNNSIKIATIKATYDPRINKEVWLCTCNETCNLLKSDNIKDAQIEAVNIIKEMIPEIIKEKNNEKEKIERKIEELIQKLTIINRNIKELKKIKKEL